MQTAQFKLNSVLEPLTYVPGLVGDIAEYIVANAHRPNRVFALGAAVSVVGTLISPRAVGPIGNATHLYVAIVGPTGSGRAWPCEAVAELIEAAGAGVHRGDFASPAALNRVLTSESPAAAPVAAVVIDEILGFLTRDRRFGDTLCASWSSTWSSTVQVSSDPVCAPPFSLFGTARGGEFWPLLQGAKAVEKRRHNLFSQFLIFESAGPTIAPDIGHGAGGVEGQARRTAPVRLWTGRRSIRTATFAVGQCRSQ
jgi:hypothetical protein